jgi:hypothetical protein
MKVVHKTIAALALASLVGVAAYAARPIENLVLKATADGGKVTPAPAAMVAFNYYTGFEPGPASINPGVGFDARVPGWVAPAGHLDPIPPGSGHILDQPSGVPCVVGPYCWGTTTAASRSLWEAHVDVVHPFGGSTQHLRISTDRTTRTNQTGFGVGIDARLPINADVQPVPNAPNTVSIEMAITNRFGMDYVVQPQHVGAGYRLNQTLFHYYGFVYTIDDACGATSATYLPFGIDGVQIPWDTTGGYQNFTIGWDTCKGEVLFYYGGVRVFPACIVDQITLLPVCVGGRDNGAPCLVNADCRATCMWTPGTSTDQLLLFGDNYPNSSMDVDDVNISMQAVASTPCGDNFISYGCGEQCEIGPGEDANCPGRCLPDCTCSPICTATDPCPVVNGANGPYLTSSGYYSYTPSSPFVEIDDCGSTTRSGGNLDTSIYITDAGGYVGYNDDCNTGVYGGGSDPNASCYLAADNFNSCTCVANTGALLIEADSFGNPPPAGSRTIINVNKKAVCAGDEVGSCCDTNDHDGDPAGCEDNVTAASCTGPFDTWSATYKCDPLCVCIPDCDGRECGSDGCGGVCLPNDCDDLNFCTDDSCGADGVCVNANNTLPCDDLLGQGPGDGLFCTSPDVCGGGICAGPPRICTDNNVCNGVEQCDEDLNICTNPDDLVYPDDLFCNGIETCDPITGIVDNEDPCDDPGTQVCYEEKDECFDLIIPTVSEWGLVILTLLLLTGAKVYFSRRQATA